MIADTVLADPDDRPAVVGPQGTTTRAELACATQSLATHLLDRGVGPGDRVLMLAGVSASTLGTILAVGSIGATVVPINLRLRPDDIRFQAEDSAASFVVVDPVIMPLAQAAGVLALPHLVTGEHPVPDADAARLAAVRPDPSMPLLQLYTSGTTGRPKGALLSHGNWLAAVRAFVDFLDLTPRDIVATPLPYFHVAGVDFALSTLAAGATIAVPAGPMPADAWAAVDDFGATVLLGLSGIADFAGAAAGRRVRGIYGPTIRDRDIDAVDERIELWTGYGASELCGFAAGQTRAGARGRPGSIGHPLTGYEARVVDPAGNPVPTGEVGELIMRGPAVTSGYWNLPEATEAALRDGWLHTGDLASVDADGCLYFRDRLKDMVKSGGENVYCVEVEEVLLAHPAVRECAVIGVPDDRWGEAVKAVVVAEHATADELDAWCLSRLAAYKRPRWYSFVPELPRNALTKVLKTDLRAAHDPATATRLSERP
jgi:acyl-CoA synthetase (AMP-forming)/AMP-acid ligase II